MLANDLMSLASVVLFIACGVIVAREPRNTDALRRRDGLASVTLGAALAMMSGLFFKEHQVELAAFVVFAGVALMLAGIVRYRKTARKA
jgi:hypothetical protein